MCGIEVRLREVGMDARHRIGRRAAAIALVSALATVAGALATVHTVPERAAAATVAQTRPNVVVIETDDQTDESMRVMANVNRLLATEGVRFDNSFVSFSLCCPSRATFLTGQYAHNHGVMGNSPPQGGYTKLDHSNTLAVWLHRAGYHTALVGKYLNGYGSRATRMQVPPGWSEWHGAPNLPYLGFTLNENGKLITFPANQANYQTDVFAARALDVIHRVVPTPTPLFLWVTFVAPHSGPPRDPDDRGRGVLMGPSPALRHRNAFASEALPQPPSFNEADVSDKPTSVRRLPLLRPRAIAAVKEVYQQRLESLLSVDEAVGSIVSALQSSGELDDTLIIFTSDNGFMQGEHRIPAGKTVVYEPSIRVPLVLRGPGVARGRQVKDVVSNVDLAPTILDAANAKPGRRVDGRSLLPLAHDALANYGRDLLLETPQYAGIRTDRFKYVEYNGGDRELYDLRTDPSELQSRQNDQGLAGIRAELARRLAKLRTCSGPSCREGPRLSLRGCRRAAVRGADVRWVTGVRFWRQGRAVKTDTKRPFKAKLARRGTIRAQVVTRDGRSVTLTRVCR
jgi:N-acetylglucosamine-6-sulfatase